MAEFGLLRAWPSCMCVILSNAETYRYRHIHCAVSLKMCVWEGGFECDCECMCLLHRENTPSSEWLPGANVKLFTKTALKRLPCNHDSHRTTCIHYMSHFQHNKQHTICECFSLFQCHNHLPSLCHSNSLPFGLFFHSFRFFRFGLLFSQKLNKSFNHFSGPCANRLKSAVNFGD